MIIILYVLLMLLYGYGLSLSSNLIEFLAGFFIPPYAIFVGLTAILGVKTVIFLFVILFIIFIIVLGRENNEENENYYQ